MKTRNPAWKSTQLAQVHWYDDNTNWCEMQIEDIWLWHSQNIINFLPSSQAKFDIPV